MNLLGKSMMAAVREGREAGNRRLVSAVTITGLLLSVWPVQPSEASVPWECSGHEGEAHTRCMQTFIELQREKIAKLEGERPAKERELCRLQDQANRQAAAAANVQQQLANRPAAVFPVPSPHY